MNGNFAKGDRVKHVSRTDWGLGEVVGVRAPDRVQVLFEDAGVKDFKTPAAQFAKVSGEEAKSEYLTALVQFFDNAKVKAKPSGKQTVPFTPFPRAVEEFLRYFPNGFQDLKYLSGQTSEREYKVAAHNLMLELLGCEPMGKLIADCNHSEVCDRAKRVVNKTNLIHQYEKIWLANGLSSDANQRTFAEALNGLLYGNGTPQARFEHFADALYGIHAAKWPIATYFLFIAFPQSQIFVKPEVTKHAADVLGLSIDYRPELNWSTYSKVLRLAETLRAKLSKEGRLDLVPRDMIDVQSFIWVIAPGYFI